MTKFKLKNMAITGVMALGIAAMVPSLGGGYVNAQEVEVWSGDDNYYYNPDLAVQPIGIGFKVYYDGDYDRLVIDQGDKNNDNFTHIYYTDVKNAKTKLPPANKWLEAETYINSENKEKWYIDLSSYTKETVIYIAANSTSPSSENILAITIPAKPTLKIKLANVLENNEKAFSFTTTSTTIEESKNRYKKVNKNYSILEEDKNLYDRIEVKTLTSKNWSSLEEFFDKTKKTYTLSSLQKKGTTLYFRLSADESIIRPMSDIELSANKVTKEEEIPRYSISDTQEYKERKEFISVRPSNMSTFKVAKKANAPATLVDYDKFTLTINSGSTYAQLTENQYKGIDNSEIKWEKVTAKKKIDIPQGKLSYIAVKKEANTIAKKPESNIAYLTLGLQDKFNINDRNPLYYSLDDSVIVSKTLDNAGRSTGIELYIGSNNTDYDMRALSNYQYCYGKASEILTETEIGGKTVKQFVADKVKWSKLILNIKYYKASWWTEKTVKISNKSLSDADTILVRKASDKNAGKFASEFIIFTKDKDTDEWKRSTQTEPDKQVSQVLISQIPLNDTGMSEKDKIKYATKVRADEDYSSRIACHFPAKNSQSIEVDKSKISVKIGRNTFKGDWTSKNDNGCYNEFIEVDSDENGIILNIDRYGEYSISENKFDIIDDNHIKTGLEKETNNLNFTITLEAGAIYDHNGKFSPSNKIVNTIKIDTKAPKLKSVKAVSNNKIELTFDDVVKFNAKKSVIVSGEIIDEDKIELTKSKDGKSIYIDIKDTNIKIYRDDKVAFAIYYESDFDTDKYGNEQAGVLHIDITDDYGNEMIISDDVTTIKDELEGKDAVIPEYSDYKIPEEFMNENISLIKVDTSSLKS